MFSSFMCFQIVYSLNSFYKYSKRKRKSIKNGNGNILHYYKNKNLNVNRIGKANRNAKLVLTIWRMKESMSMRRLIKFLSGGGHFTEKMARIGGTTRAASLSWTSSPGTSLIWGEIH